MPTRRHATMIALLAPPVAVATFDLAARGWRGWCRVVGLVARWRLDYLARRLGGHFELAAASDADLHRYDKLSRQVRRRHAAARARWPAALDDDRNANAVVGDELSRRQVHCALAPARAHYRSGPA